MKRLSIALATIGLSAGALAALPAATDPTIVNVPQLPGGFVIGGTGFYVEPSDSNGDLDYASINTGTGTAFSSSLQNVQPGYDWGWGANIGYIFPNTGNDINLSYLQFSTTQSTVSNNGSPGPALAASITPIDIQDGLLLNSITHVSSGVEYNLNQVDLTAGQYIDVGCRLILHPNVGVRWSDLQRQLFTGYFAPSSSTLGSGGVTSTSNGSINVAENSDFSGVGPLAGLDATYYIGMGFGAVAHVDSALLVGDISSSNHDRVKQNNIVGVPSIYAIFNSFNSGNQQRIVPVIDAKLGGDYTYVFNNPANTDLTLEAGWMVSKYYDAIDRLSVNSATISGLAVVGTNSIVARTTSNLGLSGPYVSLVLRF